MISLWLYIPFIVGYIFLYGCENSNAATSCPDTTLLATHQWKTLDSPNFPNKFHPQTQCNWMILSPSGYRVKIKFLSFYLVGGSACAKQYIRLVDMYTSLGDGPYCGNTSPPTLTSTGRRVRIELESNAVGLHNTYRGFRMQYTTTVELPSIRVRDGGGGWRNYATVSPDSVPARVTLPPQTTTSPTRDPSEVDENNNAAIDAENRVNRNDGNQNAQNDLVNNNNNFVNNLNNYKPTTARPRKPKTPNRFRPRPAINRVPPTGRPTRIYSSNPSDKSKGDKEPNKLPSGAIAAIVLVAIVIVAIIFIVIFRFLLMRKKDDKSRNGKSKKSRDKNRHHSSRPNRGPTTQRLSESSHRSKTNSHHEHTSNKYRHLPGNVGPPTKPHSGSRPKTHKGASRHDKYDDSHKPKRAPR